MSRDYSSSRSRRMEPMGYGGARVYVGDLGHRIGRLDLQREFEHYGQVLDVWMTPFNNEGRNPENKFAFVVFRHQEDAEAAVADRNGRHVCGRKVRVEHAKPPKRDYQPGGGYRGRGGFGRGGGGGSYYNSMGSRQPMHMNDRRPRQRSFSPRDRGYRRSRSPPSNNAPRNRRPSYEEPQQYQDRNSNRTAHYSDYSPDRRMKRQTSFSPDQRPKKQSRSSRQDSPSMSPSPLRQPRPPSVNSLGSRSLSPPSKRVKKKKKSSRKRSMSGSPASSPEPPPPPPRQPQQQEYYSSDEEDYKKSSKSHKSKKSRSSKKKRRDMESGEDHTSENSNY